MKIGILTYHRAHNYGAYIQACALCSRLNMEDNIDCEIIDFRMKKEITNYSLDRISKKRKLLRPFWYKFKKDLYSSFEAAVNNPVLKRSSESLVSDSIDDFNGFVKGRYDVIIAGSDEIWKVDGYRGFPTAYWLIGDLGCRKLSYAASSRSDFDKLNNDEKNIFSQAINDFEFIGVREEVTAERMRSFVSEPQKIHVCCDPSFLYDFPVRKMSVPELLKGKYSLSHKKKTIVVMTNYRPLALAILKSCIGEYNLVSVFDGHLGYHNVGKLTPLEWVEVIANADLVITSYFHGTCLSIIHQTPFISVGSKERSSKIESLFGKDCKFKERYIPDVNILVNHGSLKEYIGAFMKKVDTFEYVEKNRAEFNVFLEVLKKYETSDKDKI